MGEWPLVGREQEMQRAVSVLERHDCGLVLAGPAGVGKTRLMRECLARVAVSGVAVVHARTSRSIADVALGALGHLLPPLPSAPDTLAHLLREAGEAVAAHASHHGLIVTVDDAHLLDETSAMVVYNLAAGGQAMVLATVRTSTAVPEPVFTLWKDGLAERLEIGPLDDRKVGSLLFAALDGPVAGDTIRSMTARSEGNALYLRELVLGALADGSLSQQMGIWRQIGPMAPPSVRLVELVDAHLGRLTDLEHSALAAVAIGEPVGPRELEALSLRSAVAALEERGLVRVTLDGQRLCVRPAHPIYGDVIRSRTPKLLAQAINRGLADAVISTGARRRTDLLRVATWGMVGGGPVDSHMLLAAAEAARARHDLPLAERLARAATAAGAGFDARLLAGMMTALQGRCQQAENELAELVPSVTNSDQRGRIASARSDNLQYGLGDLRRAMSVAATAEAEMTDCAWRDELTAKRAGMFVTSGRTADSLLLVEGLLGRTEGRALVWSCVVAGLGLTLVGRLREARDVAERGHAAHLAMTGAVLQWDASIHLFTLYDALACEGQLAEAERGATVHYDKAVARQSSEAQAYFSGLLAKICLAQGRVQAAAQWAREAASLFKELGRPSFRRFVLSYLAHALALSGQPDAADDALAEIDKLAIAPTCEGRAEVFQARAWAAVAAGDLVAGRAFLEHAVAAAADNGDRVPQSVVLHDLARLGHSRLAAPRLAKLAEIIEGDLVQARASHAACLLAVDGAGLEKVSEVFEAMGANLLAAEAAADAAVAYRRALDRRRSETAQFRAATLACRCQGASTPALAGIHARSLLTEREREIALLATTGAPNKEIATRLELSVRSVENHLQRAYQKLGITSRSQLAAALSANDPSL